EVPAFAWRDGRKPGDFIEEGHWFPIVHCRECGQSGYGTWVRQGEVALQEELQEIGRHWFHRSRYCRFISFGHGPPGDGFPVYLCPSCIRLQLGPQCDLCGQGTHGGPRESVPTIPVRVGDAVSESMPPRFLARCPECSAQGVLSILASRAPSLLSV